MLIPRCEQSTPPVGDPKNNRVNAANYTSDIALPSLFHEIGHLMGLPDEYIDPNYPFLPLGEHDSLMNSSSDPEAVLYPRHLQEILAYGQCEASTGETR